MRIGMLCHNYPPHPGGLEVMVQNLARGLARRHEVVLVSTAWEQARGENFEDGIRVHRLPALHASEGFGVPYPTPWGPGVRDALRALESVDVLHAHGALYPTTLLAASLAARKRKPLVLTEHVGFVQYRRAAVNGLQRAAWKLIGDRMVRAARVVVSYNTRVQQWLAGRYPQKQIRYVGNGVDIESFRPRDAGERARLREQYGLPRDELLLLYAGRASEKKNLEVVLEMPRQDYQLVVCGARRDLKAERIIDLGVLPYARMPDLFGCVDMMVHASSGEGLPLAVQEGLASGLPLVLLWDDGYSGWVSPETVEACQSVSEIAGRVLALAADPARRRDLGVRARAWAERNWSWDATVQAYEALYRESLGEAHHG